MRSLRKIIILVLSLAITTSCDKPNVLTEYSKTDGDDALFYESQKLMDAQDWDGAIDILTNDLSATFRTQTKVKERLMHAYGGKCGINFFTLINSLKNVSSTKMFEMALQIFSGKTTDITACDNSIAILREIGATADLRTNNQNVYAALLGLTRMAVAIKTKLDTESSGLGDGSPDAGWNSCTPSTAAGHLSDEDINRVATGIGLIFENLSYLSDELTSGSAGSSFDAAKTLCETSLPAIEAPEEYDASYAGLGWEDLPVAPVLPTNPTYADFGFPSYFDQPLSCTNTLDSAVTDNMRVIMRRLIASSAMGVDTTGCNIAGVDIDFTFDTTGMPPFDRPQGSVVSNCCPNLDP